MLKFRCRCGQKIGVPDSYGSKRVRCPTCSRAVHVPAEPDDGAPSYNVESAAETRFDAVSKPNAWTPNRKRQRNTGFAFTLLEHLRASKGAVFVSFLIILFGTFWLFGELNFLPHIHWLWTLGLIATGVLTLVLGGINKQTLVIGPYLVICAGFSVLRQTGNISLRVEIPLLIISFGVWLFIVVVGGYALPDLVSDD